MLHAPGTFSWADLDTCDGDAARQFYSCVFDWQYSAPGSEGLYQIAELDGKPVAGLLEVPREAQDQYIVTQWNAYITVEDAEATAARAESHGAAILLEPFDVADAGRLAAVADPAGAVCRIWQPYNHPGAGAVNQLGALSWNELNAPDLATAVRFYASVFGWAARIDASGDAPFVMFDNGGIPVASATAANGAPQDGHARWMVYFGVDDCDQCVERVVLAGGKIVKEPRYRANIGRSAIVLDNDSAPFAIVALGLKPD